MESGLRNSTALVTGAGRGIGRAIAAALAREGARLLLVSRTAECLAAAKELSSYSSAEGFRADISRPAEVRRLFGHLRRKFKALDLLVNCAGVAEAAPVAATSDQVWARALAVNLTGTFLCCRAALKLMVPRRRGHIINVLSVAAVEAFPNNAAYCASKFGALGFTRVLREEARPSGIRVTAVLPGPVRTSLWDHYWPEAPRAKMLEPEDVARAVLAAAASREKAVLEEIVLRPIEGKL